jgi:cyclophilin family peptidyl-prolyl cis-trans isomerase
VEAQSRLAILQAEERRAPTPQDVALIVSGAGSADEETQRITARALGRLERPALIPDILPGLKAELPEIRAEAATALGQAAVGWRPPAPAPPKESFEALASALTSALRSETDASVRAALSETIGRLPYRDAQQVAQAETLLIEAAARNASATDRLGAAKGLWALVRFQLAVHPPAGDAVALLRRLAVPDAGDASSAARVRRLSLEALTRAREADADLVARAARDRDAQMRRLAMRAGASGQGPEDPFVTGLADESAMVRIEALRTLRARGSERLCAASIGAAADRDLAVALVALDQLAACAASPDAIALLDHTMSDLNEAGSPRGWHRTAHALVATAAASPEHATRELPQLAGSRIAQLRLYAAQAATILGNRSTLEMLARDDDDNVREAAVDGLVKVAAHGADTVYLSQLSRNGYQILRAAAIALDGTPDRAAAVGALRTTLARLVAKGDDNSRDARDAIAKTLKGLGAAPAAVRKSAQKAVASDLNADDLRRLAAPRARLTVRGVGTIEIVLITSEAPATVLHFARLAESGYYNGTTFHRVEPNFVIQGGSPGASEYVGDARFMRDEVGQWPHVRGAVGISTRGRDTGDAQIFIDLVDIPALDHEFTVFGQVLNGLDLIGRILEGDVIERVEILTQ